MFPSLFMWCVKKHTVTNFSLYSDLLLLLILFLVFLHMLVGHAADILKEIAASIYRITIPTGPDWALLPSPCSMGPMDCLHTSI
jgi:hypothetical protein